MPADSFNIDTPLDSNSAEKTPDLLLRRRVVDVPGVGNTGEPDECGYIDIGAFEYGVPGAGGDMDQNGIRNGLDIQPFCDCFVAGDITGPCAPADLNRDGASTFEDVTCLIKVLLDMPSCADDCPAGGGGFSGGGEGGESQSQPQGEAGNGQGQSGQQPSGPSGLDESQPEEVEDPEFTANWNAYVEWLEAHWFDQYPEMTVEEWDAMAWQMMIDMVYDGVAP